MSVEHIMSSLVIRGSVIGSFLAVIPVVAQAGTFSQPAGLAVGAGYRLAFLSQGTTTATSSDISTYNAFVASQAALNSSLPTATWTAIISTGTVNAVTNVDCAGCDNVPIFLVDGTEVAQSTTALFQNSYLHGLNEDQNGLQLTGKQSTYVFTGSTNAGVASGQPFGSPAGSTAVEAGYASSGSSNIGATSNNASKPLPLYALSSELFAGSGTTAVPEPASAGLLAGGALVALVRRRKKI